MTPLTEDELIRAIDEASRSGNYFLLNVVKRMASELRELRDQASMSCFAHGLEWMS